MQVDASGACWLDADEHHRGLALRTGGALNCSEWNDGREALRLGHDASLEQAGAQHSLSPVMPRRRSGDCLSMRLQGSQTRVNSQIFGRRVSVPRKLRNRKLPPDAVSVRRQLPVWGLCVKELSLLARAWGIPPRQGVPVLLARTSVMLLAPRVNLRPHQGWQTAKVNVAARALSASIT